MVEEDVDYWDDMKVWALGPEDSSNFSYDVAANRAGTCTDDDVYWETDNATVENYSNIVEKRLIPFFNADVKAKDICRILRLPGFYHWKDENDPFMVEVIYRNKRNVTEREMLRLFDEIVPKKKNYNNDIPDVDNIEALKKLSGTTELNGENFGFVKNSSGYQIFVDGKSTSSWIDKSGMIGSYERGGPTWVQWVMWYGHSKSESLERAKGAFEPKLIDELVRVDRRIESSKELLNSHVVLSPLLDFLEDATLRNVKLEEMFFDLEEEGKIRLRLAGEASSYASIVLQAESFGQSRFLKDQLFSDFDLNQLGNVNFDFTAIVDKGLVNFKSNLDQL